MRITKTKILIAFGALILIVVLVLALSFLKSQKPSTSSSQAWPENQACIKETKEMIVRGDSLSGVIEDGATVKILFGVYDCNPVERGDIVIYKYAGNADPIIKIIRAVSGDGFKLNKAKNGAGWNILVNGEVLKNSKGEDYIIDDRGYRLLALYERDYEGIIPDGGYLILGNLSSGSTDSTQFGLVAKGGILGKVVLP